MAEETKKRRGRPKASDAEPERLIDEPGSLPLMMDEKEASVEELSNRWQKSFTNIMTLSNRGVDVSDYIFAWNRANPFIQNQRVKNLSTRGFTYSKEQLAKFAANPGSSETSLRAAAMTASSSQQIFYNILRRSCDVPVYNHFVIPELLSGEADYRKDDYRGEAKLVDDFFDTFDVPNSLKTIALQVKREGKCSYIFRNRFSGSGKKKTCDYACFEKLPTDWIKITGIGQLGYTVSFDFSYFLQVGNDPAFFGEFFVRVWEDMMRNGIVTTDKNGKRVFDAAKARGYSFDWGGSKITSSIESRIINQVERRFIFWVALPFDLAYTFSSDNSTPFVAPDTTGLLQKLQELTDYGTLAGLIASTPLTAVLTGEAEFVEGARPNKNETKISPEVLLGLQTMFNSMTSSNVEAYFMPLKNIKLQQLNADVNSSDITTKAMKNLVAYAGEGGLTITTDKPSIAQVRAAEHLVAEQQRYVTLQIQHVLNYILKNNLGFKYRWKIVIWGDVFFVDDEKSLVKEQVQSGNLALLPKLMSGEGINMTDTEALTKYVSSIGIYDLFRTMTMERAHELGVEASEKAEDADKTGTGQVGRPEIPDSQVSSDSTAISKDSGANTKEGRETASLKCPICHKNPLEEGEMVCEHCLELIMEEHEE